MDHNQKIYFLNFYKAITIAFFFSFTFSNQDFHKCLWIKSDQLNNEESIKNIISDAYRAGYEIIFLQLAKVSIVFPPVELVEPKNG